MVNHIVLPSCKDEYFRNYFIHPTVVRHLTLLYLSLLFSAFLFLLI